MDPEANKARQKVLKQRLNAGKGQEGDFEELVELRDALRAWEARSGFISGAPRT